MTETAIVGVTGAAGYVGSRVAAVLLDAGHDVIPIDDFCRGDIADIDGVAVRDIDVRDRSALRDAFADVDAVAHLAAESGVEECTDDPERAFDVNVGGTENIAWLCREQQLPLLFPGSMAVLGDPMSFPITADHRRNPLNLYGLTKTMSEEDVHHLAADAFPAHVFLLSNLYGTHAVGDRRVDKGMVINRFVNRALAGERLRVHRPGTQARDFIHVKDVGRAYRLSLETLLDADPGATTFTLAGGDCRSVIEIAETVRDIVADELGDEIGIDLVEHPREHETAVQNFSVDTAEARETIGFEPSYDVERGVREMVRAASDPEIDP